MSDPYAMFILERKVKLMSKTPMDLPTLQAEYDRMVEIALDTIESGYNLDPTFEHELTLLMRVIKSMGGNVR
jgi:hypothetical protein